MMQENGTGTNPPQMNLDLDNQILFVEFMLQGYREPTGQKMLEAIKSSLEKFREIKGKT